jgi:hypothetical protein
MAQRVLALVDAGPAELPPTEFLLRIGMPSRVGVCITRERARRARDNGELAELAREVSEGRLRPDERGLLVVEGEHATLPWRGVVEDATSAKLGPPGEVRVLRKPDGRVWIYLVGGMLGRHQNQVGFLYSSRPFVPRDSEADGEGGERVCLEPEPGEGPAGPRRRYLLSCFTVIQRLAPELLEVGSAPD